MLLKWVVVLVLIGLHLFAMFVGMWLRRRKRRRARDASRRALLKTK